MTAPDLVLFTNRFPYDGSESVLRDELEVTARRFNHIYVLPSYPGSSPVSLPDNVACIDMGWAAGWSRTQKIQALRTLTTIPVLTSTLTGLSNVLAYGRGARSYLDICASNLIKARDIARWATAQGLNNAIFYDYWFENTTLALAILRRRGLIRSAVSRAHQFDVFDWRWETLGRVPFREFKAAHLDAIFAISDTGTTYLCSRLAKYPVPIRTARLGTAAPTSQAPPLPAIPHVVSCAALRLGKDIHRIPSILRALNTPVSWTHLGDGPERSRVLEAAADLPRHVEWRLVGKIPNTVVREFYATHGVSAFLSVSQYEGIPVSMMEAQSYGIPIVSLDVGSISELVVPGTGLLLNRSASDRDIAAALLAAFCSDGFDRSAIQQAFLESYDSSRNYERFADTLLEVWRTAARPRCW